MYTLKSIAKRGTTLGAAFAIFAAAVVPVAPVFADALNPLTERSLLLSSSAPGFQDTDGSGYATGVTNGNPAANGTDTPETYAPAGSGPNGKKSGETFTFRTSTASPIQAFTFQYCTTAAGLCQAPGDNTGDARDDTREENATAHPLGRSDLHITGGDVVGEEEFVQSNTLPPAAGEFQVSVNGVQTTATDWVLTAANKEDDAFFHDDNDRLTGKNNNLTLSSATGQTIPAGARVMIEFNASESRYITNPGSGSFFVKINSYSNAAATTVVDGGVTVANVMTDSIHITTKVLETMAFSVGTDNPDIEERDGPEDHGTCEAIVQNNGNRLDLGNPAAENSLETGRGWDVESYWRLSSNSSGGATVYYSGNTLANTVGDEIAPMTSKAISRPGTEQFGLGFVDVSEDGVSNSFQEAIDEPDSRYKAPSSFPFITFSGQGALPGFEDIDAQPISNDYADASGTLNGPNGTPGDAEFKFLKSSSLVPEAIAQQNQQVISCATAKMRYVGNIGADTPAGVYTTKINYLAAPQY